MRTRHGLSAIAVALSIVLAAAPAPAQTTPSTTETTSTTITSPGTSGGSPGASGNLFGDTGSSIGGSFGTFGSGLGPAYLPPVPFRSPVVFYPSLTLTGEYNDNIFLDNSRRRSDYIAAATPAFNLYLESTTYRWAMGYSFTAEKYLEHSELDEVFQRQTFFIEGSHRVHPRVTLTLSNVFLQSKDTNPVGNQVVAVGRRTSLTNTFNPGLIWQFAPRTSLTTGVGYELQRFDGPGALDSDIYRFYADINHDFSARFSGLIGYEGRYIDVQGQHGVHTHTPRFGFTYRFTPFLTTSVTAGPTIIVTEHPHDVSVTPFVDANLTQLFGWGSLSVFANRSVGTSGGVGDTTANTSFGAALRAAILRRFVIEIAPSYSISESVSGNAVDVHAFSVDLRAAYRFTDWLAAVGGYRYFHQTSDSASASIARDVEQNRAFLGLQVGWPFRIN